MKKCFLLILISINIISTATAGEKRINLYGGYVFDDKFESFVDAYNYYNGKIKGGLQYGAGVEFMLPPFNGAELLYIGQRTTAPIYYYPDNTVASGTEKSKSIELNFNYAMAGFTRYFLKQGSNVEPYATFMLGALFANAHDPESGKDQSATKFTWGAKIGTNIMVSDNFGFKLQGMLLSATQAAGGTLYFGSGGYGPGTTTASSMLQFSVSGGVVYRLFKKGSGD